MLLLHHPLDDHEIPAAEGLPSARDQRAGHQMRFRGGDQAQDAECDSESVHEVLLWDHFPRLRTRLQGPSRPALFGLLMFFASIPGGVGALRSGGAQKRNPGYHPPEGFAKGFYRGTTSPVMAANS